MAEQSSAQPVHTYRLTQWLFLRGLGAIYFIAFTSLAVQIDGLLGHSGISPADDYLRAIGASLHAPQHYFALPTVAWFGTSNAFLNTYCWLGALAGLLVLLGIATGPCLLVAWVLYLSLVNIGQDFLSFQWDILLLEAGFVSMLWAPWCLFEPPWKWSLKAVTEPSLIGLWLLRWLVFRLMFLSGCVKLLSGDLAWRSLDAMKYHYETQPLPTPMAWFAHQLPAAAQSLSSGGVFFIELIVPFLIFCPRHFREAAALFIIGLQILIMVTGNYTFFNLLTICLCLSLCDDQFLAHFVPSNMRQGVCGESVPASASTTAYRAQRTVLIATAVLIGALNVTQLSEMLIGPDSVAAPAKAVSELTSPFHIVNTYGLFAVMTTRRYEITVEGTKDGEHWIPYTFKYKPGPLDRAPPVVAPHQPRLDWQMWFASLGSVDSNQWFVSFMRRLLEGTPEVVRLLERNPFPDNPPKAVRARLSTYTFTNSAEKAQSGKWWRSVDAGTYLRSVTLGDFRKSD